MSDLSRRDLLKAAATAGALASAGCADATPQPSAPPSKELPSSTPAIDPVLGIEPLPKAGVWPTADPFLFCVHHNDFYPAGNPIAGPSASLEGRRMGSDFSGKDGWSMYHGQKVAGFPRHPHRGFETVTAVRKGLIDHADSLGAAARYGDGDVQWLTAGDGINHAEMFPLLDQNGPNTTDFFQIWLNLPAKNKRVSPYFSMLWANEIPTISLKDPAGKQTKVTLIAGALHEETPPPPPPNSWASQPDSHVGIWTFTMEPGASWTLPASVPGLNRNLYVVRGNGLQLAGKGMGPRTKITLRSDVNTDLINGTEPGEYLMLQGKPIGEPIAQRGPFVMNTWEEIRQAYADYQQTQFGGWPWDSTEPVHGKNPQRFARRGDDTEIPS
jgi:redox-sensitive bicupin YhaK (pirin superfamily)